MDEDKLIDKLKEQISIYISKHKLSPYLISIAKSVALTDLYNYITINNIVTIEPSTTFNIIERSINSFKKHDRFAIYVPKYAMGNHKCVALDIVDTKIALKQTKQHDLDVLNKDIYNRIDLIKNRLKGALCSFSEISSNNTYRIANYIYDRVCLFDDYSKITNKEIATALSISTRTVARHRKHIEEVFREALED